MKTKLVLRNENLWKRIQGFSLDAENATFPFSKKLAKEENWSSDFAQKAIAEYKKFVYLCCISPNGASPSEIVDKVWHMHLIYTQNYWEDFCPNILKRSLHHHPSTGGSSESIKHQNWFSETLENYRAVFSQEPPSGIWNQKTPKLKAKTFWLRHLKLIPVAAVLLLLGSCSNKVSSVLLTVFVLFFASFLIIYIIGGVFESQVNKNKEDNQNGDGGSSCSGGGSSCSSGSSCGSSCGGGGCGGCGS